MPTTTVSINTKDSRDVRGLRILNGARGWLKLQIDIPGLGQRKFYGVPSESQPEQYHRVNLRQCSCPDFQNRQDGGMFRCAHMRAVRWYADIVRQEVRRKEALAARVASLRENRTLGDNVTVIGMVDAF